MNYSQEIEKRIKQGLSGEAIKLLLSYTKGTIVHKEAILLSSRYAKAQQGKNSGVADRSAILITENQINYAVLELLQHPILLEKEQKKSNTRRMLMFGALVFLLSLVYFLSDSRKQNLARESEVFSFDSTYHILLLPFGAYASCSEDDYKYHIFVRDRLDSLNRANQLGIEVKILDKANCELSFAQADSIGREKKANLVIWGCYGYCEAWSEGTTQIYIKYSSLDQFDYVDRNWLNVGESGIMKASMDESFQLLKEGKMGLNVDDVVYWALGIQELAKGNFSSSLENLQKIQLEEKIEFSQVWYFLGLVKTLNGLDGYPEIEIAASLDSNSVASLKMKGDYFEAAGKNDSAIYFYSQVVKRNGYDFFALNKRGTIYRRQKRYDLAIRDYNKSIELFPDFRFFYNRANLFFAQNKYDAALIDYRKAKALQPGDAEILNNMGYTFFQQGLYDSAYSYFDKAIVFDPQHSKAHNNRGIVFWKWGKYDSAFINFKQSIALTPDYADPYSNLGMVYYEWQQYDTALICYDKAIAIKPDFADAYYNRGNTYWLLKKNELALTDYDKAISIKRNDPNLFNNRGLIHTRLKKFDLAISDYKRVLELSPHYATAFNNMGFIYYEIGKLDSAIYSFKRATQINPRYAKSFKGLGDTYFQRGEFEFSFGSYSKAIDLDSSNITNYINRAYALQKLKKPKLAMKDVHKSLEMNADIGYIDAIQALIYADAGKVDSFYYQLEVAIHKPIPYPLHEELKEENAFDRFSGDARFQTLVEQSREKAK